MMATEVTTPSVPVIRRLTIERFRGIEMCVWYPEAGVNILLGGGDVGKSTILDAVALLLSPTNTAVLSDADYWQRQVEMGFCIEAVMFLPEGSGINQQGKPAWPWEWDGKEPKLPSLDEHQECPTSTDPVYRLQVRGSPDFELLFEILQPNGTTNHLSVAVRRKIGLVRLGGDDRNDRDLRLVQGSALERLLSDKEFRARLGSRLSETDIEKELKGEATARLTTLDESFRAKALPHDLSLGLVGGQGISVNALIGLTASKFGVKLPLTSWGAGTRRLAALQIAAADQEGHPLVLVDELERGLEPYRQRVLMMELLTRPSQVFVTTHSASVLKAASSASLWHLSQTGTTGLLKRSAASLRTSDPEALLARVTIVAEGVTEVGFLRALLSKAISADLLQHGIWIADGGGNTRTLDLLEELADSGFRVSGFADEDGQYPGRWAAVQQKLGALVFRWSSGCLERNIIMRVPADRLEEFIRDPDDELTGERLRTLAERLGSDAKHFSVVKAKASNLVELMVQAATGAVPDAMKDADPATKKAWRKHAERWFKSEQGGQELAGKMFTFGVWPQVDALLMPFLNALRLAVSLEELAKLPSE